MKRLGSILWGIVLVALGVLLSLRVFNIVNFDLFFSGWWTLFIIVPCFIALITEREKVGSLIGLGIGVVLLLACQGVFAFDLVWKLLLPFIVVVIGLKLIFGNIFNRKAFKVESEIKASGEGLRQVCATFSGQDADFSGEEFKGAELTAVFGGVKCDLRNAVINSDAVINVCSVFGGVDIYLPANVNVKISSNSIFGGFSDKRPVKGASESAVTVYIKGTCIFGGAEIK